MASPTDNLNNAWAYFVNQCTRFVAGMLSWIPPGLGNAKDWYDQAAAHGLGTTQTPQVGSVAVWGAGPGTSVFGHVAVVTGLVPGGFTVREENFAGAGVVGARTVTGNALQNLKGFLVPKPVDDAIQTGVHLATAPLDVAAQLASVGPAIAGFPRSVGQGLATMIGAGTHDVGVFLQRQFIAFAVAAVVLLVLFA
jgi:hypothetical protein